ncbi:MAG: DUF4350 domain-containing protein [Acidimicrobiales bacterium]
MRQKGALVWVGLFLVAVVVGFVARPGRSDGVPLDPRSTAPDGARALRELLDRYADDVGTSSIDESTDTLIVLEDSLDADSDEAVLAWVRDGGHLIWLDNRSTFTPLRPEGASIANADGRQVVKGVCSIEALADLSALSAPSIRLFATDGVAASCFGPSAAGTPGGTTAVAQYRFDRGRVTVVGGATLVDNAHIAEADNAAMIVRLATSDGASAESCSGIPPRSRWGPRSIPRSVCSTSYRPG